MACRPLPILAAYFAATAALMAASSPARAELASGPAQSERLDQPSIRTLIAGIAVELREGYVFPDKGAQAADALEKDLAENAYADVTEPVRFALHLTEQLQATTQDSHVRVIFGSPFRNQPLTAAPQDAGFTVKQRDGNIAYLHVARFVAPEAFNPAADNAMRAVSNSAALIIDMRDNGGGHPASVAYLASFFLDPDKRVPINDLIWRNRGTSTFRTESFWSSPTPVHYLSKPVYVLIGPKTYSAGEEFAYDLHVLQRATLVGERTRGGANPGGLKEIGSDLFVVVPSGRAENPITHGNWGGVGVHPDVQVTSEAAQETAIALATGQLTTLSRR